MRVDYTFERENLSYGAMRNKNSRPEESRSKRSQAQTPLSELPPLDVSQPRQTFDEYVRSGVKSTYPEGQKIGNPLYGAYVMDEDGEMSWQSMRDIYDAYGGLDGLHEFFMENAENATDSRQTGEAEEALRTLDTIKELVSEKKSIKTLINNIARKAGVSSGDLRKLKIDVDASGKVLVGGLADTRLTKKLQEAFAEEAGFAARLKSYQGKEEQLYNLVEEKIFVAGAASSGKLGDEIDLIGMDLIEYHVKEAGIDNLDSLGMNALAYAAAELFRDETVSADFSHKDKGLADPGKTIHNELWGVNNAIRQELDKINLGNRMAATNNKQPPGETVSMDNIKITLNENGEIIIEGSFAQSAGMDSEARVRVNKIIQDKLNDLAENGGESNLLTAMRQLRLDHDEEFGESEFEKIGSVTFDAKKTETFIAAPEAKLAMKDKMEDVVIQAVKDETGVELESGSIEVTEEGKIILNGLPPSADAAKVRNFIDSINKAMELDSKEGVLSKEDALNNRESEGNPVKKTVDILKGLLEELASYEQRTERYFPMG